MSEQAITKRVKSLGDKIGVSGLSAHDLRHYSSPQAALNGTALDRLQDVGSQSHLQCLGVISKLQRLLTKALE